MGKRVIWKISAQRQVHEIEVYLQEEFGSQTVYDFLEIMYQKLERIIQFPESGHLTPVPGVRRLRIRKYINLFYRTKKDGTIVIHLVWNSKQDPEKNPYR